MEAYAKLESSILASSVWAEPDHVRLVWITLLAMAKRDGTVQAGVHGISQFARVPLEQTREALDRLMAPDPDSRDPDHDGRRVQKIHRGYLVLNYSKRSESEEREAARKRAWDRKNRSAEARRRKALSDVGLRRNDVVRAYPDPDPDPDRRSQKQKSEAEGEGEGEHERGTAPPDKPASPAPAALPKPEVKPRKRAIRLPDGFAPNAGHRSLAIELGVNLEAELPKFTDHHTAKGSTMISWDHALRNWLRNAQRFNGRSTGGTVAPLGAPPLDEIQRLNREQAIKEGRWT